MRKRSFWRSLLPPLLPGLAGLFCCSFWFEAQPSCHATLKRSFVTDALLSCVTGWSSSCLSAASVVAFRTATVDVDWSDPNRTTTISRVEARILASDDGENIQFRHDSRKPRTMKLEKVGCSIGDLRKWNIFPTTAIIMRKRAVRIVQRSHWRFASWI